MDRNNSVPHSPSIKDDDGQQRQQPTPPTAFPFSGLPAGSQPVLNQPAAAAPGYPMQAHVLYDPVTGQHYIVPQPYYQPLQPMYYPPPQPPNQPAHMYYPYPKQPQQPVYMGMYSPANSRPATSAEGPSNEDKSEANNSEDAMSTTSNISRSSFSLMQNAKIPQFGTKRENSREYMFRSPTTNHSPFLHHQHQQQQDYEQPLRSPIGRAKYENPFVKLHRLESEPSRGGTQSDFEGKPTPKFAYPTNSSSSDVETSRRFGRQRAPETPESSRRIIEQEIEKSEETIVEEPKKPRIPPAKSVRMEINFDDVPVVPEEKRIPRKSNATAFTVTLDSKEKDLSLQEAARNLAENRRNRGKIVKMTSQEEKSADLPVSRANKNYLLEKLLTGKNSNEYDVGENAGNEAGSEVGSREDFDMRSEALTFVIDTSKRTGNAAYLNQNNFQTKVVQFSDDEDSESDSESEIMQQYSQRSEPPKQQPIKIKTPSPPPPQPVTKPFESRISRPSTSKLSPRPTSGTSDFLQELAKLRLMAGLPASGIEESVSENDSTKRSNFRRAETSSARAPTVSSTQKVNARASFSSSRPRESITTTPTPSRKTETRRSLTGTSSPQLSGMSAGQRPPFKSGTRGILLGQSEEQREQERNAWLRRKDYNPMKAAAAARKPSTELKSKEQQFQSRRSITINTINNDPFAKRAPQCVSRPTPRNRSQEPRQRRPIPGGDVQKLSGLAKAVDMLSAKCKKSIELIRLQNKGCLSVSVEDLLQTASEPPRPNESLDEQLERLSDAFDAVQRYLEQSPLDGFNSPTPDAFYDDDDVAESRSTFSGVSTHQENRPSNESISSSYRKKVLDSS